MFMQTRVNGNGNGNGTARSQSHLMYVGLADWRSRWRARMWVCPTSGHVPFDYGWDLGGTYCLRCHRRADGAGGDEVAGSARWPSGWAGQVTGLRWDGWVLPTERAVRRAVRLSLRTSQAFWTHVRSSGPVS